MRTGFIKTLRAAQAMEVRKRSAGGSAFVATISPGVTSWTAPAPGLYKFCGWGGGGGGDASSNGGSSGAYFEITKRLVTGQVATCSVGRGQWASRAAEDTTLTLPGTPVATAGGSSGTATGGVASGGDINLNGSPGGSNVGGFPGGSGLGTGGGVGGASGGGGIGGGAGSPANFPLVGAKGGGPSGQAGGAPGGGAVGDDGGGGKPPGGSGLIIILKVG